MKELTRTKVSRFLIEDALTLSQVSELKEKGMLEDSLLSVPDMFPEYKQLYVTEQGHRFLMNGNPLKVEYFKNQEDIKHTKGLIYLVYDKDDRFCAMYQLEEEKLLKPYKMFLS